MEKLGFGGVIVEKDKRDFDLSKIGADIPYPPVYKPDYSNIPVDYQGKIPACGSHAGSKLKDLLNFLKGKTNTHASPRYLWREIKQVDGYGVNLGTDIYSILKSLKNKGVCSYDLLGNDVTIPFYNYANPPISNAMINEAVKNEISSYATTFKPSMSQIKQAIYQNGAVIILMRVGENMYKPSWKEKDILPLNSNKPMDSGHYVVGYGYDEKYIHFRNSWGVEWGKKGDGWFGEDYIPFVDSIATAINREQVTSNILPLFERDLTVGYGGADVRNLQIFLNNNGFEVALTGDGSKGFETKYFGNLTRMALSRYQEANNISPAVGYFGPLTRASVNAVLTQP